MTLRGFINAAYACLVEEFARHPGESLLEAIDKVSQFGIPESERKAKTPSAADNARSMDALMGMMGGVKGAPV